MSPLAVALDVFAERGADLGGHGPVVRLRELPHRLREPRAAGLAWGQWSRPRPPGGAGERALAQGRRSRVREVDRIRLATRPDLVAPSP
jgi:hypothetical protein